MSLKEEFLKLLEEDREFRYAVMGMLGFRELLERFARLEERQAKLEERQQALEERFAKLEERFAALEERFAELEKRQLILEERFARLEERFAALEERQQVLEERFAKLEERQLILEERVAKLEERFLRLEERQLALEKRFAALDERVAKLEERFLELSERVARVEEQLVEVWRELGRVRRLAEVSRRDVGALSEAVYSRFAWEDLREQLEERGERVVRRRRRIKIDGEEVDLLVETVERLYVIEVKVQPDHHDVDALLGKARAAEKVVGKPVTPVLAGVWVGDEVRRYAEARGVEVYEY